jgi:hypothetical protein
MTVTNQNNESWLHRVLDERTQLEGKVDALRLFLGSSVAEGLAAREQADLREQLYHMESYAWVLQRRLRTAGLQTNN